MKASAATFWRRLLVAPLLLAWLALAHPAMAYYNYIVNFYQFFESAAETVVNDYNSGINGTVAGGAVFSGTGQVLLNDGVNRTTAHVQFPPGLFNDLTNATFETWVYWTGGADWQRIFDFGTSDGVAGQNYVMLTPNANGQRLRFTVSTNSNVAGAERVLEAPFALPANEWVCVTVSYNYDAGVATMYVNGQRVAYGIADIPLNAVQNTNNWIGRAQYSADPYFMGQMEDFRIHWKALTAPEVAASYACGPVADDSDPGTLQAVRLIVPPVTAWSTVSAQVMADFQAVTNVDVTVNEMVVYESSDTNVFTVDTNGVITAKGSGTATLTVTYQGMNDAEAITLTSADNAVLAHRYSFDETSGNVIADSVGTAHGMITNFYDNNGGVITNFFLGDGKLALPQDGTNAAYVDLPNGIISSLNEATFEMWVVASNVPTWQRVFDFGASNGGDGAAGTGTNYLFLAPQNPIRFETKAVEGNPNLIVTGNMPFPAGSLAHIVCTYNYAKGQACIYVNGRLVGWGVPAMPLSALVDLNVWLGRSQYSADPAFRGEFHEFRIYEGSMSAGDVAASYVAGPAAVTNAGSANGIDLVVGNTIYGQQQAQVLVEYEHVGNVDLANGPGVTYTSSDPSILQISPTGLLLGQRNGSATVTVNYLGFSDSQGVEVNMGSDPLIHRYPFNATSGTVAEDVIGGAHGNLLGGATFNGTGGVALNGSSSYVDLPNGIVSRLTDATFEAWVIWNGGNNWQRIWDFGSSTAGEGISGTGVNYLTMTPKSGQTGNPAAFICRWLGVPADLAARAPAFATGVPVHVVVTYDWSRRVVRLFVNGQYQGYDIPARALSAVDDFNNWLGRSQFNDPYFNGQLLDFRIYRTSLSAPQIAMHAVAGLSGDVWQSAGVATALRLTLSTNTLYAWQVGQAKVMADFEQVSNLNVTLGDGVIYTSSDPAVVTVNENGLIQAVGAGTATVTATYPGTTASDSQSITVQANPALIVAGTLHVDLRATNASATSATWINEGTLGNFTRNGTAIVETPAGTAYPGVFFNGSLAYVGPAVGDDLGGNSDRSIEVWTLNPAIAAEETLVSMGARDLGDRQNASFNYGSNTGVNGYGAIGFWGGANDLGWPDAASVPAAMQWHHIVYTYNGARLASVYVNGKLVTSKTIGGDLATDPARTVNLGAQRSGTSVNRNYFSGYINSVRVHGGLLDAGAVLTNYLAGPVKPAVSVVATVAANITTNSATLQGTVLGMTAPTEVTVFFGTTDGGSSAIAWQRSEALGVVSFGSFGANVTGLTPGATYFYRVYGSNAVGEAWSAPVSFVAYGPAVVANVGPKTLTPAYAHLVGRVVSTNGLSTEARLYWGETDGGTDTGAWQNRVDFGARGNGELVTKLSGLQAGQTYFYRWYAVNAAGESWSPATASITPQVFQPLGYAYMMTFYFAGYSGGTTLTNFPALVILNEALSGFQYSQFLSGNADLRFTDANGGELNYEIESWDSAGSSYVWVQLPELTAATEVTMYWGKAGLTAPAYTTNGATFNDGFAGVWHMTNAVVKDSSPNGYHANYVNNPATITTATGKIGPAQSYSATANTYTAVGVINFTNATFSAWVWCQDASREGIFMCKDGTPGLNYGDMYFWQQGANLRSEIYNWGGDVTIPLVNAGGAGTWIHVAATINGLNHAFYTNGVLAATWAKAVPGQNNNQFQLSGSMKSTARTHKGMLDEMRAEWVARSPQWIQAAFANQATPDEFVIAGPVTERPLPLTFASPAVSAVDTTTAEAVVRVLSDGGNGIFTWGTAWATTPQPAENLTVTEGMEVAPYDIMVSLTGLQPGGHYYVRGFASNAVEGVQYSPDAEFYTEPLPASDLVFGTIANRSMTLSWAPGAGAAGVVVLVKEGAAVSVIPEDGVAFAANARFGAGVPLSDGSYVVYAGAETNITVWDLNKGGTYHVAVYAYAGSGGLVNYQQDNPVLGSQTTANAAVIEVGGNLLVDLSVSRGLTGNALGQITRWQNFGTVGGEFALDGAISTAPVYAPVAAQPSLAFDGTRRLKASFPAPPQITGRANDQGRSFSIEYWAFNPSAGAEEWVLSWARRGGPDGTFAAVGYGTHNVWGAVAHWGASDMAFGEGIGTAGEASMPTVGQWHHIAVTYDGVTERIYVDGVLNAQETKNLNIYDGDPMTLGMPYESSFAYSGSGICFSGNLASLRVHSAALTAGQVADNFGLGVSLGVPVAILGQPQDMMDGAEYSSARFTVFAVGDLPVSYQWYRNDELIPDATNATYQIGSITVADSGAQFYCIAANTAGGTDYAATSSVVSLTVRSAPVSLIHRYSFTTNADDSVGTAHGTLQGTATVENGAAVMTGVAGTYVELPGGVVSNLSAVTIEFWASFGVNANWARVFDFGDQNASLLGRNYLMFTPHSGSGDTRMSYSDADPGYLHEVLASTPGVLDGQTNVHVAAVYDPPNGVMRLHINGELVATAPLDFPLSSISNVKSWIGKALYEGDAPLNGSIDEFRIYDTALAQGRIRQSFQQGPELPLGDPLVIVTQPVSQTNNIGGSAELTVLAASVYPVSYQWYVGEAAVEGAASASLLLTNLQLAAQGDYFCVASNAFGALTSLVATLTVVSPLAAADDGPYAIVNTQPIAFNFAQLLSNDVGQAGVTLTVIRVDAASTNGAALTTNETGVIYTPAGNYTGEDLFTYTVSDGQGGEAIASVRLFVVAGIIPPQDKVNLTLPAGQAQVRFSGTPGVEYQVQRAETLNGTLTTWTTIQTITCPPHGLIEYLDTEPPPGSGFYRVISAQ